MEEKQLKIFAIVVTYRGMQWYDRCFTSLRNSAIPVQTIVVDNASGDGTVEYIKEHYPEILLIESKENLGFGKGNNIALKYAYEHDCDYVFLLNQDAWIEEPDMFEKMIALSIIHPDFGIISPIHLSADKKHINMAIEFGNDDCAFRMLSDLYCNKTLADIYETDYVNAAGWLLPRNTLSTLGGFDPLIFHYGEDDDYLNRARFHGIKIGVCPSLVMIHDHQNSYYLKYGQDVQKRTAMDDLPSLLNLQIPFRYHSLRWKYCKMYIKAKIKRNKSNMKLAEYRYNYIKQNRAAIECSREKNSIAQPNWIQ